MPLVNANINDNERNLLLDKINAKMIGDKLNFWYSYPKISLPIDILVKQIGPSNLDTINLCRAAAKQAVELDKDVLNFHISFEKMWLSRVSVEMTSIDK